MNGTERRFQAGVIVATIAVMVAATSTFGARVSPVAPMREGDPTLARPAIGSVVIRRDSVFFCGTAVDPPRERLVAAFDRSTRIWSKMPGGKSAMCVDAGERGRGSDTTRVDDEVSFARVRRGPDSSGRESRPFLELIDSRYNRQTKLFARIDQALARRVAKEEIIADTSATGIGATLVTDSIVWLGLGGSFSEGETALGGIYRVERRSGRVELLNSEYLDSTTVIELAVNGPWLWAGTVTPAEYGPYGSSGLLRLDARTGRWRSYNAKTSPIPDALIRVLKSDGKILALATELGIAVAELRDVPADGSADPAISRWNVAYFVPGFVGDTLKFDLGAKSEFDRAQVDENRYMFVQQNARYGHERPMFRAILGVPSESLYDLLNTGGDEAKGRILADTTLVPELVAMLGQGGSRRVMGAFGIARLGARAPRTAVHELQQVFSRLDAPDPSGYPRDYFRSLIGRALVMLGDSTPTHWAREVLRREFSLLTSASPALAPDAQRVARGDVIAASAILAEGRDSPGLGMLIGVAPLVDSTAKHAVVDALARYDDRVAWSALLGFARSAMLPRREVIAVLTPESVRDTTPAEIAIELIRAEFADGSGSYRYELADAAARLRLMALAPTIVTMIDPARKMNGLYAQLSIHGLVSLTGRAAAPIYTGDTPPRAIFDFWNREISGPGGLPPLVDEATGRKAVDTWRNRRNAVRRDRLEP